VKQNAVSTDGTLSYEVFVSEPIPLNVTGLLPKDGLVKEFKV